ncbi:DUF4374 domain-containing protein [Cellulophaga baltica]|uniref:DUF4374 domain-containing protein n=1 Tax=Cellulophaga TaxID=104264 RepID=UPI001C076147|nr:MULTISPECIES: DUF4374 domain-containing protein [Cellulophaga]MBU2995437.1 DUF4374 domain-containing protein [Cellulophaga baltica]MDO6766831.1 DUF4374 domain-containing protein [Cellulophaga sp. 1_MG-2023]
MKGKINFSLKMSVILLSSLLFIQCSEDDSDSVSVEDEEATTEGSSYYVGIEYGSDGADYLSVAESLSEGVVSPVNNGFEQLAWASYIQGEDQLFSIVSSALTSYAEDENGNLSEGSSVTTSLGVYAYDVVDESTLVAIGSPWYSAGSRDIYVIDTDVMSITSTVETELGNYTDSETGEEIYSMPSGAKVAGDYLFISYYLVDLDGNVIEENKAKVAVYSYPGLELQNTITDDRIADIGRYYSEYGIVEDENGDVYVMSSSSLACGWYPVPTVNSGLLRINSGEADFDDSYYVDFETISSGYKLNDLYYVGDGKAVVRILSDDSEAWSTYSPNSESPVLSFGILDIYEGSFTELSGEMELSGGGWNGVVFVEDNTAYVGVSNSDYSGVYVIDVENATVVEGADIDGNYAKAILGL